MIILLNWMITEKKNHIDKNNTRINTGIKKKRRKLTFTKNVKKEDGYTAKLYSRPEYLIRDGSFLRPKAKDQVNREKRMLKLLGVPESLAGLPLPPGLFDEEDEELYDPDIPNDYKSFIEARQRLKEWVKQRDQIHETASQRAKYLSDQAEKQLNMEYKLKQKEKDRERERGDKDRDNMKLKDKYKNNKHYDRERDRDYTVSKKYKIEKIIQNTKNKKKNYVFFLNFFFV